MGECPTAKPSSTPSNNNNGLDALMRNVVSRLNGLARQQQALASDVDTLLDAQHHSTPQSVVHITLAPKSFYIPVTITCTVEK